MGFKNLHSFNLVMLGKQGWNFLTNQETIIFKVFKSKYFPNVDFLDVKLGNNPSYVWGSIFASPVVVRQGMKWKIGNGSSINIWHDLWLNSALQHQVSIYLQQEWKIWKLMILLIICLTRGTWNSLSQSSMNMTLYPSNPLLYCPCRKMIIWFGNTHPMVHIVSGLRIIVSWTTL